MNTIYTIKNWEIDSASTVLESIHDKDINIAIWDRDSNYLNKEIDQLLNQNIALHLSGDTDTIFDSVTKTINQKEYSLITSDIFKLLQLFKEVSRAKSFRLLLATIHTNMCRRFHADRNNLRMLCTYSGPGTMWLTEDNVNRQALDSWGVNKCIVIDKNKIQQAKTGSIVILKGTKYAQEGTRAVIHRSPTIEETGTKRLVLRIDIN